MLLAAEEGVLTPHHPSHLRACARHRATRFSGEEWELSATVWTRLWKDFVFTSVCVCVCVCVRVCVRFYSGDIESVSSDHCAFNMAQKAVGKDDFRLIPAGVNGVAERLTLVWNNAVVSASRCHTSLSSLFI